MEREGFDFVSNQTTIRKQYSSIVRSSKMDCEFDSKNAKQKTTTNIPQLMVSWIWIGNWSIIAGMDGWRAGSVNSCETLLMRMLHRSKSP